MFEGARWTTDCSPEASSSSPAPTPAKNMDLGTFEAHAGSGPQDWSEPHDWAETFAAPFVISTALAMTNGNTTLLSIKHFMTPPIGGGFCCAHPTPPTLGHVIS